MIRSCVFGFVAFTLCLLTSLCANAVLSKRELRKAVKDAQATTALVLKEAQEILNDASSALQKAETYKRDAEKAAREAAEISKKYPGARSVAEDARRALDYVGELYKAATVEAEKAVKYTRERVSTAEEYDKIAKSLSIPEKQGEYEKMNQKANDIQVQAGILQADFDDAKERVKDAYSAQDGMSTQVETAQVAKYQADTIAADAKSVNVLKQSEAGILLAEKKRDDINAILKEMQKLNDKAPDDLKSYIHSLYASVEGEMRSASHALEEAKSIKQEVLKLKTVVDTAVVNIKKQTKAQDAENEASTATGTVTKIEEKAEKIKEKLDSVTTSAATAVYHKKNALKTLETGEIQRGTKANVTPNPSAEGSKGTPNKSTNGESDQPVGDGTKGPVNGGTVSITGAGSISAMSLSVTLLFALIVYTTVN